MEAQDSGGTPIRVTDDGLIYGEEFVAFDEMGGVGTEPHHLVGPSLFDLRVLRKKGPDLVIRDLPGQTAAPLRAAITEVLRERYG